MKKEGERMKQNYLKEKFFNGFMRSHSTQLHGKANQSEAFERNAACKKKMKKNEQTK